jgi:hypothetical protein
MNALDDGTYDVFIVDAEMVDEGVTRLELTITTGAHKGEVVEVRARALKRDVIDLMGTPATLVVVDGQPRVVFD